MNSETSIGNTLEFTEIYKNDIQKTILKELREKHRIPYNIKQISIMGYTVLSETVNVVLFVSSKEMPEGFNNYIYNMKYFIDNYGKFDPVSKSVIDQYSENWI